MAESGEDNMIAEMLEGIRRDGGHLSLAFRPFGCIPGAFSITLCLVSSTGVHLVQMVIRCTECPRFGAPPTIPSILLSRSILCSTAVDSNEDRLSIYLTRSMEPNSASTPLSGRGEVRSPVTRMNEGFDYGDQIHRALSNPTYVRSVAAGYR